MQHPVEVEVGCSIRWRWKSGAASRGGGGRVQCPLEVEVGCSVRWRLRSGASSGGWRGRPWKRCMRVEVPQIKQITTYAVSIAIIDIWNRE